MSNYMNEYVLIQHTCVEKQRRFFVDNLMLSVAHKESLLFLYSYYN